MMAGLRREYRLAAEEIAVRLRLPRTTVASHLWRRGLGRLAELERRAGAPLQRARAGELVHLDIKKLACFRRIGHRITGHRRQGSEGAGWEFVHVAVDDASRLAYVEVLPDERRRSTTGFLVRALRWFEGQGIRVERVMAATVAHAPALLEQATDHPWLDRTASCGHSCGRSSGWSLGRLRWVAPTTCQASARMNNLLRQTQLAGGGDRAA